MVDTDAKQPGHPSSLSSLGLDPVIESVYVALLDRTQGVADICARLALPEHVVRSALDRLSELALVRASIESPHHLHAVSPHVGMEILIAEQRSELARHTQRLEAAQAAAARFILDYDGRQSGGTDGAEVKYLVGLDAIRDHLKILNGQVAEELLTFAPGGPQKPENMQASRPLNQQLLRRGVQMRTVYLNSIRNDRPTMEHAHWLTEQGCEVRTVPSLPNRMIIYDRKLAMIASDADDTGAGAVQVSSPGMVTALLTLFDSVWQAADQLEAPVQPAPGELTCQQAEALRLLALGLTDEAIATRLAVSPRTARRITSSLMTHLGARSRFQAGVLAIQQGFLPARVE
ncbi:helix-turn-helix transcriptional regulator [Streptomyces venezuelae]|uniref:Helix-turn-helix transcriptional regulator n=1 Tax=Streptomyces venezuelae TaxID=54571 RepID=A0A5P2DKM6_STRVZ|nr:helix-turn-helix transcriptional regulator [Streptomyces venezuelae]QES55714.1 helix-turn-helix transcriptional regulator [Streptomyces venezuelae]